MGMLYKRGEIFWIKYYLGGKPIRESTMTTKQKKAEQFLKDREGRAAMGAPALPHVERVRVEELLTDLTQHYETTGRRTLREVETRLTPLLQFFTGRRANAIGGTVLTAYIQHRQAAGLANGTINRELSVLGTAYRLGEEHGRCFAVPSFICSKRPVPGKGFLRSGISSACGSICPRICKLPSRSCGYMAGGAAK